MLKIKKLKNEDGITLFIAIVIMGILLFISFAVLNITLKANLFATSGRDSQYAFYAADAGLECAIYWDSRSDPSEFDISTAGTITCAGQTITTYPGANGQNPIPGTTTPSLIGGGGAANRTSKFGLRFNLVGSNPVNSCAIVTVTKNINGTTDIESRGYNTCDTTNPRRIERGIEIK